MGRAVLIILCMLFLCIAFVHTPASIALQTLWEGTEKGTLGFFSGGDKTNKKTQNTKKTLDQFVKTTISKISI